MRNARSNNAHNISGCMAKCTQATGMRSSNINSNQHIRNGENGLPDKLHPTFGFRRSLYLGKYFIDKFQ